MAVPLNQTTTVQELMNWCSTHTTLQNYFKIGGQSNEPALKICNSILQTLLSRPCAWKFNRKLLDGTNGNFFVSQYGITDYRHAGACAFVLQTGAGQGAYGGASIDLAQGPVGGGVAGITISGGIATVQFLQPHPFQAGQTVFFSGLTDSTFNAAFSFTPIQNTAQWSGSFTILTAPDRLHITFAAPAGTSATITNIAITNNVITVTAANSFKAGQLVTFTGVGTNTFLNGQQITVTSATGANFTGTFQHADVGAVADTGTVSVCTGAPGFGTVDANKNLIGLAAWGWGESASLQDMNSTQFPQPIKPIQVVRDLSPQSTYSGNDLMLCMFADENNGVLRFRLSEPLSSYNFQINVVYQGRAPRLTSPQSVFAWPDDMQYVLNEVALVYAFRFAKGISDRETSSQMQMATLTIQNAMQGEDREASALGIVPDFTLMRG